MLATWALVRWLHRVRWWRRRGMVAVTARDRRYTWTTPRTKDAVALLDHVERLIRSATWIPGDGPQPELPGATRYSLSER